MPEEVQKVKVVQEEEFLQEELQRYLRTMLNIWHLYGAQHFADLCITLSDEALSWTILNVA